MKACIGIVSWLPTDAGVRQAREVRLQKLIDQINSLFPQEVDVLIIAQDWNDFMVKSSVQDVIVYNYGKLGILAARNTLRERFIENNYDYLIMFDDDAIIQGSKKQVTDYLATMTANPQGWCFIKGTDPNGYADSQLNLCAISRYIYENQGLPAVDPQKNEGFEDRIFSCLLKNTYSTLEFDEPKGLKCIHFKNADAPIASTWSDEQAFNWKYMRARTAEIEKYIRANKKLPNLKYFYSKSFFENQALINDFNQKNHFIQLWGDCSGLGYLGELRTRGPVDNVYSVSPKNIQLLLDNKYLDHIKNTIPKEYARRPSFTGDIGRTYDYSTVKIIHNNPLTPEYIKLLTERINTFNEFYKQLQVSNNYYFTVNLNHEIVDPKTNTFLNKQILLDIINILDKYNVLNKTIFVGLKQVKRKDTSNMWVKNFSFEDLGLKYIEIEDNDVWNVTDTHLQFIDKFSKLADCTLTKTIDLVVPYVDSNDTNWQKLFKLHNPMPAQEIESINAKNRFRGQGDFFRFFFRCLEHNLPWIRRIFLLVQSKTQVPTWLDQDKVTVITHDQFIPKEYLPTFNSCTIEMFLWNIPRLSSNFLYMNDDVFALKPLKATDFFENGKIKESFLHSRLGGMFGQHCDNVNNLIFGNLDHFIRPGHGIKAYNKVELAKCYNNYKSQIIKSITKFRSEINLNCFIFDLWQVKQKLVIDSNLHCNYIANYNNSLLSSSDVLCINDANPEFNIYGDKDLINWFDRMFHAKSKYERTEHTFSINAKQSYGQANTYLYF